MTGLERVSLGSGLPDTTRLGFGCSNLLGNKTRAEGLALLETAYDAGVRHFDVAPYYGYGDAEQLVGEFAKGKRSGITITTKFGLQPMLRAGGLKHVVNLVRKGMRASPWLRSLVRRSARNVTRGGQFDVPSAQRSLETSLLALRTDVIDVYLLHDCRPEECTDELLKFLETAKSAGKIRSFGTGTSFASTQAIRASTPAFASVMQFKSSVVDPDLANLVGSGEGPRPENLVITHGPLTALPLLQGRLASDAGFAAEWAKHIALDPEDDASLAGLLLQHAMRANPGGLVLFQSSSRQRVTANIVAATEPPFSAAQLDAVGRLGRAVCTEPPA